MEKLLLLVMLADFLIQDIEGGLEVSGGPGVPLGPGDPGIPAVPGGFLGSEGPEGPLVSGVLDVPLPMLMLVLTIKKKLYQNTFPFTI